AASTRSSRSGRGRSATRIPSRRSPPDRYARAMRRHPVVLGLGLVTLIAGIAMTATDNGVVVVTIGLVVLGIGGVLLVSLAFLLVGESEDRDRERRPGG